LFMAFVSRETMERVQPPVSDAGLSAT
jgi:hypothetical protein